LNQYPLASDDPVILKLDCEGCEYEVILSADGQTLQKFYLVMIEYHYGCKNLKQKLERIEFKVSVTRPKIEARPPEVSDQRDKLAIGHIFAKKC
jgi:Methyltransferase FkbM domain